MRLEELRVKDLYELMDELDGIQRRLDFNSYPFAYRTGIQRMRVYLDHVASGLRMIAPQHCVDTQAQQRI